MSVSDNYVPIKQLGNGSTTAFTSSTWTILSSSYLKVYLEDTTTGVQTLQTLGSDYTLTFGSTGFTVTFTTAPPNTKYVVIGRSTALDQTNPYKTSSGYQGGVLEDSLDKLTNMVQENAQLLGRSLNFPLGDTTSGALPTVAARKGLVLYFDSVTGAPAVGAASTTAISAAMIPVVGAATLAAARAAMVAATSGANGDITSLSALTDSLSGLRNIVINGGFTVNQRVYVSGATLAAGVYGHDRWKAGASGGDYSFTQLESNTQITIASGKSLIQVIENKNVQATRYVLSWSGTAQARIGVNSATPSGSYAASPIVITGQTIGTTMSIEFNTGTLGTVQIKAESSLSVGTPFESRTFAQELGFCQRHYQKAASYSVSPTAATTQSFSAPAPSNIANGGYISQIQFRNSMGGAPTVTTRPYSTPANTSRCSNGSGTDYGANSASVAGITTEGFGVWNNSGGTLTASGNQLILFSWEAEWEL